MYTFPPWVILLAAFVSACPIVERDVAANLEARQGSCASYNYDQQGRDWATQCPSQWKLCGSGTHQSPINLPLNNYAHTHVPTFNLPGSVGGEIFNRGFGPEWHPNSGAAVPQISFDGYTYSLLQWHTHTPTSEHAVNGARTRAETHFVFGSSDGPRAVLGARMVNSGTSSMWFNIYAQLGSRPIPPIGSTTHIPVSIDFASVFSSYFYGNGSYWTYNGSLTTPDCGEGIRWFVAGNTQGLNASQFQGIENASINSVRALQTIRDHQVNV